MPFYLKNEPVKRKYNAYQSELFRGADEYLQIPKKPLNPGNQVDFKDFDNLTLGIMWFRSCDHGLWNHDLGQVRHFGTIPNQFPSPENLQIQEIKSI